MCKYLTTVIRVIVEIRVFFMVFALGTPCFEAVPATAATTTDVIRTHLLPAQFLRSDHIHLFILVMVPHRLEVIDRMI